MTKKHSTRRALVTSVLALALCFTMLLGTTYAWFTDSVTSANNIIKTGNLDVEMYWADGTLAVPADESADWADASTGAIFDYALWEPGYVQVRHIKIANVGSLALKYSVSIVANGLVSDLSDVIDVYYVDPAVQVADRTALTESNKLGTLTEVLAGLGDTASGALLAGTSDTITIALKMQESAGNKYMLKSIGTSFSVQLFATQYTYEEDSFGNDYDEMAAIDDLDELKAALDAGYKVINANGANLGEFNNKNNQLSIVFTDGVVIQNAKFTYFYGGNIEGTVTFENCEFVSDDSYSANFDKGNGNLVFNNCRFDGWNSFGSAITGVEMNNCSFKWSYKYGTLRFYQDAELNNCVFDESFGAIDTNTTGTVIEFTNCTGIEGKLFNNTSGGVVKVGTWIVDGVDVSADVLTH